MKTETLDIVRIIEETPIINITESCKNKLLEKIKKKFNTEDQKIFFTSFYCYLNYNPKKDFVIDFDSIWKWCGFSRKDPAKRVLEKYFVIENDYKVFHKPVENLEGGRPAEQIMLTINTFKKFCLKANTKKADEIHDYYINLEQLLHETIIDESTQLQLQNKMSQKLIEDLNKKIEKKHRTKYELANCVYIISNDLFKGYYKVGKSSGFNKRLDSYSSGSPIGYNVDYICKVRNKSEETIIETMVLQILSKYRVKNHMDQEREWLYNIDLFTIKKEINVCLKFLNMRRNKYEVEVKENDNKVEDEVDNKVEVEENEEVEEDEVEDNEEVEDEVEDEVDNEVEVEKEVDNKVGDEVEVEEKYEIIIESDYEEEEEIKKKDKKIKQRIVSRYNLENINLGIKRNNPIDFQKFVKDYCRVGKDLHVIQSELKLAFKIWSKTPLEMVEKQFLMYMNDNFKDKRMFLDNQRRHVFIGIELKPFIYKKTKINFDFEQFIEQKCKVNYLHSISYQDFFYFFTEWKRQTDPDFRLNKFDKINMQKILEENFAKGRIKHSIQSKTKSLCGILGVGIEENNYGIVNQKRHTKTVGEYDVDTNELLKTYESMYLCSIKSRIPFSTFSTYITNKTVINGKYYELI